MTILKKNSGLEELTEVVDADEITIRDVSDITNQATGETKRSSWTNIKVFLKTYFDTLYNKYVHPNHSGEVTSTTDGAQTITNKAVTLSKMNDMATASFLGRNTAGTGTPEVLSKATVLSLLDVATAAANIAANTVVVGDDGAKAIKHASAAVIIPTINLTGGQIAFPATAVPSADANTLDDYEEGTWTPDLTFGGAKVDITYSLNGGLYTKVGRKCSFTSYTVLSSKGSSNGNAVLDGYPFTSANVVGASAAATLSLKKITFADFPHGMVGQNGLETYLYETTNAGVRTNLTDANFANDSELLTNVTYFE